MSTGRVSCSYAPLLSSYPVEGLKTAYGARLGARLSDSIVQAGPFAPFEISFSGKVNVFALTLTPPPLLLNEGGMRLPWTGGGAEFELHTSTDIFPPAKFLHKLRSTPYSPKHERRN